MRLIWITWETQRRNRSLSNALDAKLFEITSNSSRPLRYIKSIKKTRQLIKQENPDVIFAQNPSLILSCYIILWRKLSKVSPRIVLDYHNAGVYPTNGKELSQWAAKNADAVLVTNKQLANVIQGWGAKPIIVPDFLPKLHTPTTTQKPSSKDINVLFICSWSEDEPIREVVTATEILAKQHSIAVHITGKPKVKAYLGDTTIPKSVILTGFLPEQDFDNLIHNSDLIIDLTTRDNCMVCGAYEAVAAGVPALLSDNEATRNYFQSGMEFTDNTAGDIAEKIDKMIKNRKQYKDEIEELKNELKKKQLDVVEKIIKEVQPA